MDDPLLWLTVALFISLACNVILGIALYTCLPRAPLEPNTRTDDGEPEFAGLTFTDDTLAGHFAEVQQRPPLYLGADPTEGVGPWPGVTRAPIDDGEPEFAPLNSESLIEAGVAIALGKPKKTRKAKVSLAKG